MLDFWAKLRAQLTEAEGVRLTAYTDTVGKTTIGCGRNLTDVGISQAMSDQMLDEDIGRAHDECRRAFGWFDGLDEVRQRVLVEMMFNLGRPRLLGFRLMLSAVQSRNFDEASRQMLQSVWATQVHQRAVRLARWMKSGTASWSANS